MKCNANVDRLRGYKIKIYPTDDQKIRIEETINIYRYSYNLALEIENRAYELGKGYINYFTLCKIFSELYKSDIYPWLSKIPLSTIRQSLADLNNGFQKFFKKINRHPKFHSKKKSKKSFTVRSERTYIHKDFISISGIGYVDAKNHPIPIDCRVYNPTVTFDGYDYWFSCQIEKPIINMDDIPVSKPLGIDVGIRNMITLSDGTFYHFSNTKKFEKRLKQQQRRLSKDYNNYSKEAIHTRTKYEDIPKSKNHKKRLKSQNRTYAKIRNKRHNDIHKATKEIVSKNPSAIVIENISVTEQLKDSWIKKYTPQMMYYEIHRQIKYKAADRNIPVIVADKNYASSQICNKCGNKHKIYRNKIFKCPFCGYREDRDLNAAYNLEKLAYRSNEIELSIQT